MLLLWWDCWGSARNKKLGPRRSLEVGVPPRLLAKYKLQVPQEFYKKIMVNTSAILAEGRGKKLELVGGDWA